MIKLCLACCALLITCAYALPQREIKVQAPVLRSVQPSQAAAVESALRHQLAERSYRVPSPEELQWRENRTDWTRPDSIQPPPPWNLDWRLESRSGLLCLTLRLQGPSPSDEASHARCAFENAPVDTLVVSALNGLDKGDADDPRASSPTEPPRLWAPALLWTGYALAAWSSADFGAWLPGGARLDAAEATGASAGAGGFFAGLPPHPALRAQAGAGSATHGEAGIQALNPAGISSSPAELSLSAGKLPDGTQEIYAGLAVPASGGLTHAHAVRYEGDSLLQAWQFTSSLAMDWGYWMPWLYGVRTGLSFKGLALDLPEASSPSASEGSALGFGLDLGLQWEMPGHVACGLSWLDFAAGIYSVNSMNGRSYMERIPARWLVGLSWQAPAQTIVMADWNFGSGDYSSDFFALGLRKDLWDIATWRAGYRRETQYGEDSWHTGLGAGAEVEGYGLYIDYAIEGPGRPGTWNSTRQTISTRIRF